MNLPQLLILSIFICCGFFTSAKGYVPSIDQYVLHKNFNIPNSEKVYDVKLNNRFALAATKSGKLYKCNILSGEIEPLEIGKYPLNKIAISKNDNLIAVTSLEGVITIFSAKTFEVLDSKNLTEHTENDFGYAEISEIRFSNSGTALYFSLGASLYRYDFTDKKQVELLYKEESTNDERIRKIKITDFLIDKSEHNVYLAVNKIKVINLKSKKCINVINPVSESEKFLSISGDINTERFTAVSTIGRVYYWKKSLDIAEQFSSIKLDGVKFNGTPVFFLDKYILLSGIDNKLFCWNYNQNELKRSFTEHFATVSCADTKDNIIASGDLSGRINIWKPINYDFDINSFEKQSKRNFDWIDNYDRLRNTLYSANLCDKTQNFKFSTRNIIFKQGTINLVGSSHERVFNIISRYLADNNDVEIIIEGHTDVKGDELLNFKLSCERADFIKEAFLGLGIKENRIFTSCYGDFNPVYSEPRNESQRVANRRVSFILHCKSTDEF